MSIKASLESVLNLQFLAVPKEEYDRSTLEKWLIEKTTELPEYWLIPCSHSVCQPALETQLLELASIFDVGLPRQLRDLLMETDGADLFRLLHRGGPLDNYWIPRYRLLNCVELIQTHHEHLDTFLSYVEDDDTYLGIKRLNYLAFCDIADGNYLALNMEKGYLGKVFVLDHDYAYFPVGDESTKDAYVPVADSLHEWLDILAQTSGLEGMGHKFVPL